MSFLATVASFITSNLPAIAAAASAVGALTEGIANARAAREEARRLMQEAAQTRVEEQVELERLKREKVRRLGAIRAAAGASGLAEAGSVLDVLGDTAAELELERSVLQTGTRFRTELLESQAAARRRAGRFALLSGALRAAGAASSLLKPKPEPRPKPGETKEEA